MSADLPAATDALNWMRQRSVKPVSQVLFRGQSAIYPSIQPSLFRPNVTEADRALWWAVLRRFVSARSGVAGYLIQSPHDALAMVEQYLGKSPVIDLTGTPEIALYFALGGKSNGNTRIVYAMEVHMLKERGLCVSDHDFLTLPLGGGGEKHRWLRQDGYTVGLHDWHALNKVGEFDLLRLEILDSFEFVVRPGDLGLVAHLGDLETTEQDPLAGSVRSVFESVASQIGCSDAVRRMMPASGTMDTHQLLITEIECLIARARQCNLSGDKVEKIQQLLGAASGRYWDMAWECALESWAKEVDGACIAKRMKNSIDSH